LWQGGTSAATLLGLAGPPAVGTTCGMTVLAGLVSALLCLVKKLDKSVVSTLTAQMLKMLVYKNTKFVIKPIHLTGRS